jgi:hypothetical protein
MNNLIKNIKSFFNSLWAGVFSSKVNNIKDGQHMLEFLGEDLPYECLDLVSTFLSGSDIYTLSTLSRYENSKLTGMMSLRFIYLSKVYSVKYMQNDNFKSMIDGITGRYKFGLILSNIRELDIDLRQLSTSFNLSTLFLSNNNLDDISPIRNLVELTKLDLQCNRKPFDTRPLLKLTKLRKLNLESCCIRNVKPLSMLTNLVELDLSYNNVKDLTPLKSLTNLTYINLRNVGCKYGLINPHADDTKDLIKHLNLELRDYDKGYAPDGDRRWG